MSARIKSVQRDPMGSKPIERRYERRLRGCIADFKGLVRRTVERFEPRELESPSRKIPVSLDVITKSVQEIGHVTIEGKAPLIADEVALLTYRQGNRWADKALRTAGYRPEDDKGVAPSSLKYFLPADKKAIAKIRSRNLTEIKGVSDEISKRMTRTLVDGFERRETMKDLAARIDEVTEFGLTRSTLIARTETMRALNDVTMDRYEDAGISKVQWVAGGEDGRTCEECLALHMKVFDINDVPYLPLHPNCRCTTVAVIGGKDD